MFGPRLLPAPQRLATLRIWAEEAPVDVGGAIRPLHPRRGLVVPLSGHRIAGTYQFLRESYVGPLLECVKAAQVVELKLKTSSSFQKEERPAKTDAAALGSRQGSYLSLQVLLPPAF